MKNKHKYFRSLRYKRKLEAKYYNGGPARVFFITKEPDPRAVRESNNFYLRYSDADPIEFEKVHGRDYYISWKKPEITYSIKEYERGKNSWKKVMKLQTSRRNRRIKINEDDASWKEKSFYKKVVDRWNYD